MSFEQVDRWMKDTSCWPISLVHGDAVPCSEKNRDSVDFCIESLQSRELRLSGHMEATRIHISLDILPGWIRRQSYSKEYGRHPRSGHSTGTNGRHVDCTDAF